jgi:3-dehydroquinate synthase
MKVLKLKGSKGECDIAIGESISNLTNYVKTDNAVIVSDRVVLEKYGDAFPDIEVIEVEAGEGSKGLATVERIYGRFLELGLDRSSFVVGIGGGAVCDVTGFAASTYMRGIEFGFVPTTLLAQTDASIGGKNAINIVGYKNVAGTFTQPKFVLCDLDMLKTLPEREVRAGFAEIIKHAAIADGALFSLLEKRTKDALSLKKELLEDILSMSISVKVNIVSADETEKGERRLLNFGHTFGHAVESTCGLPHGEAVAMGMVVASRLSVLKRILSIKDAVRFEVLIRAYGLPTCIEADVDRVLDAMRKDKKRYGESMKFVLLQGIGNAIVADIRMSELKDIVLETFKDGSKGKVKG